MFLCPRRTWIDSDASPWPEKELFCTDRSGRQSRRLDRKTSFHVSMSRRLIRIHLRIYEFRSVVSSVRLSLFIRECNAQNERKRNWQNSVVTWSLRVLLDFVPERYFLEETTYGKDSQLNSHPFEGNFSGKCWVAFQQVVFTIYVCVCSRLVCGRSSIERNRGKEEKKFLECDNGSFVSTVFLLFAFF